jgi:hypothetical protein
MVGLIDNWTLLIVGCTALVLAGLIGVLWAVVLARREEARRQLVAVSEVTRNWQPTWKINAVTDAWVMENEKDDIPSNFVLRIEEDRVVRDIGGGELTETRWRPATKAEVREIVHVYHEARATPFNAIEFERQVGSNDYNGYTDRDGNDSALAEKPAASAKLLAPDRVEREGHQSVSKGAAILASPPLASPIGAQ